MLYQTSYKAVSAHNTSYITKNSDNIFFFSLKNSFAGANIILVQKYPIKYKSSIATAYTLDPSFLCKLRNIFPSTKSNKNTRLQVAPGKSIPTLASRSLEKFLFTQSWKDLS